MNECYTKVMFKKYTGKFYCFSPPVMLATFLIEFGMLFYVLWRYKLSTISRLVVASLACLGVFQLAEYMICGGLGMNTAEWSRLGYVGITLLPALGMHLILTIAGKKSTALLTASYGTAALFAATFAFVPGVVNIEECRPNYAVFNLDSIASRLYMLQYYGWLFAGLFTAWTLAKQVPKRAKALYGMIAGYLIFLVPTTTLNFVDPATQLAIPSIMCGFAVLYAGILVAYILPLVGRSKVALRKSTSHRKNI